LEFANKTAIPELTRKRREPNLWFDASVLIQHINQSNDFAWFYDYPEIPLNPSDQKQYQLEYLAQKMRPYWSEVLELIDKTTNQDCLNELKNFRNEYSEKSWKAIGWEDSFFNKKDKDEKKSFLSKLRINSKNPDKIQKVTIGHYPEFIFQANEKSTTFFRLEANVWDTLTNDVYRWAVDKAFLDKVLQSGSEIFLATEVRSRKSYFTKEMEYIISSKKNTGNTPN
jgi:hypothetical protein